jgi:hypothetical protein
MSVYPISTGCLAFGFFTFLYVTLIYLCYRKIVTTINQSIRPSVYSANFLLFRAILPVCQYRRRLTLARFHLRFVSKIIPGNRPLAQSVVWISLLAFILPYRFVAVLATSGLQTMMSRSTTDPEKILPDPRQHHPLLLFDRCVLLARWG